MDLKPHRVRGWPADPQFHAKTQAVCRLYLDPPADTVLFSVDEKTAMQATSRKRTRPIRPGQVERREFEYVRHGTISLMAALNVTTGTVHPKIITPQRLADLHQVPHRTGPDRRPDQEDPPDPR